MKLTKRQLKRIIREEKIKLLRETYGDRHQAQEEQINELMLEFGNLKSRTVTQRNFKSQVEGMEDGFYVFIEYSSQYENTKEHTEYLVLKQNDKAQWEIFDYNYEFRSEKKE